MKQFYELFPKVEITPQLCARIESEIMPQVGAQIFAVPWNHIKAIMGKSKKN